jgi:integrase
LETWNVENHDPLSSGELDTVLTNAFRYGGDRARNRHFWPIQAHFKRLLKQAGLPSGIRAYDLRHSAATLLLSLGEHPKIVAERLGHSSVTLTLDTYSHVLPDMQEWSAARLEQMLFKRL